MIQEHVTIRQMSSHECILLPDENDDCAARYNAVTDSHWFWQPTSSLVANSLAGQVWLSYSTALTVFYKAEVSGHWSSSIRKAFRSVIVPQLSEIYGFTDILVTLRTAQKEEGCWEKEIVSCVLCEHCFNTVNRWYAAAVERQQST